MGATQNFAEKKILSGISVFRGIAAFGVIYIHSPLVLGSADANPIALRIASVFGFAVPFFLLAAFYFAARSLQRKFVLALEIRKRARRLLLPFVCWTAIYLALKFGKNLLLHRSLVSVFSDPLGILLGGVAVHLYFIPLLFTGLVLLILIAPLINRLSLPVILILLILSLGLKINVHHTGNDFNLSKMTAFDSIVTSQTMGITGEIFRLLAVTLAHCIRCLPLVLIAFLFARYWNDTANKSRSRTVLVISAALFASSFFIGFVANSFGEEIAAITSFLMALTLSKYVPNTGFITKLGIFSFGIYLSHQVILEVAQIILARAPAFQFQQSPLFLLCVSLTTFVLTFLIVELASRQKKGIKALFGLE